MQMELHKYNTAVHSAYQLHSAVEAIQKQAHIVAVSEMLFQKRKKEIEKITR